MAGFEVLSASYRGPLRSIWLLLILATLAACAETNLAATIVKDTTQPNPPPSGSYKVGEPYQVNGIWYYPAEDPYYDQTGIASWYGEPFDGQKTANGEIYDMNDLTAAHKTLPMPVYVRVTNLENGRSLVLRINDRGPFVSGRIIDVSRRAAQLLGFDKKGTAKVRVQVVDPGTGNAYAAQDPNAPADTTPAVSNIALTSEEAPPGTIFVQVGAFSDANNAEKLSTAISDIGQVQIFRVVKGTQLLYRVRLGPYGSTAEAQSVQQVVAGRGHPEAIVVVE
jgi:rare lipoprotein A